ncbi:MAG TPA: glycosyltransferase [Blastocatellia bacterium]|nr:glycosyltransferase [Blastocatellia bacterium]
MYCGSCFRDNALAAELMARGHDVMLVPLYTPTLTDEKNVSRDRVFFGGISVYLQQHSGIFRRTPWLLDKLWDSRLALKLAARRSIAVSPKSLGELTVSMLKGEDGYQRKELDKLVHWLQTEPAPDIINLSNSLLIGLAEPIRKALRRPVTVTLQGEDLFLDGLEEPYRSASLKLIRERVGSVDGFLAVSDYYAEFMSDYLDIPASKMHVVPVGINLEGYDSSRPARTGPFTVGYFARIAPEKGLHVLCEAYRLLRERGDFPEARLEVAGYLGPEHRDYLSGLEKKMRDWGLADEFNYRGVLDRQQKIDFLHSLDVLSVPAVYKEPKGIFLLEAMSNGVPVVQPRKGAFPEMLERTGGGILVEAENIQSLAEGIMQIGRNPLLGESLGRTGAEGVRRHYSAGRMAERALEVYSSILHGTPEGEASKAMAELA